MLPDDTFLAEGHLTDYISQEKVRQYKLASIFPGMFGRGDIVFESPEDQRTFVRTLSEVSKVQMFRGRQVIKLHPANTFQHVGGRGFLQGGFVDRFAVPSRFQSMDTRIQPLREDPCEQQLPILFPRGRSNGTHTVDGQNPALPL